jgi:hypothetical protein
MYRAAIDRLVGWVWSTVLLIVEIREAAQAPLVTTRPAVSRHVPLVDCCRCARHRQTGRKPALRLLTDGQG